MAGLNELGRRAHEIAKSNGFHEDPVDVPRCLMLIVSEVAEAMEADRIGKRSPLIPKISGSLLPPDAFEAHVKNSFEDELADAVIRLVELAASLEIDLDRHVELKMQYNELREYKHGKNY